MVCRAWCGTKPAYSDAVLGFLHGVEEEYQGWVENCAPTAYWQWSAFSDAAKWRG
jgi:hypothetical protein